MSSLKNKKIIISAGASGIGWATAKVCLDKGATVFICDINEKYLAKTKKHKLNNKKLFIYKCDAANETDVKKLFNKINKKTKIYNLHHLIKKNNKFIFFSRIFYNLKKSI